MLRNGMEAPKKGAGQPCRARRVLLRCNIVIAGTDAIGEHPVARRNQSDHWQGCLVEPETYAGVHRQDMLDGLDGRQVFRRHPREFGLLEPR
jgi:hypothetical protein